jgi:3-deoxy-manno-octulosonate cytidylyltransferase (CMP-KDO synthetase)
MASSRFPGKPLALIHRVPMVGHVYFRSLLSRSLDAVCIATCDREIQRYADRIGAPCMMTSDKHERATDRTAEALIKLESRLGRRADIVVMIQGDEPMLRPRMIDEAVSPLLKEPSTRVVNLMAPLKSRDEQQDPNEIKVVVDPSKHALYFSREPIPSTTRSVKNIPMFKQICIIPFRRSFLLKFNRMKPTPLEKIESIDMLRVLENGYKVRMVLTRVETYSVDTPQDLAYVERRMRSDTLRIRYRNK